MNSMYLALGYRCNHHCFFCPCGNNTLKTPAASADELIKAIDFGVDERSITHITLSGGEPTLHPAFHEILAHCVDRGLKVGVLSNGDTFSNPDNVERFFAGLKNAPVSITTALHSIHPKKHDLVTSSKGSYERTVTGLLNVMSFGMNVTVKQVVSKWNYQELPQFVDFCFGKFGPRVSMTLCGMDFCGMKPEQIDKVAIDYKSIGPYLEKALDFVVSLRKRFNAFPHFSIADLPLCCVDPYYWSYFLKVSRGELSQYSAPRGEEGSVSNSGSVVGSCDVFFNECKKCGVSDHCPGVWRTAYEYFRDDVVSAVRVNKKADIAYSDNQ